MIYSILFNELDILKSKMDSFIKPHYSDKLNIYSPISLHWFIIIIICFIHLNPCVGQKQNAIQVNTFKSDTTTNSIFIIDRKPFAFLGGFIPGWHFSDEDCTNWKSQWL